MGVGMKKVTKHWGNELWIADGKDTPYATKRILSGIGILHRSKEPLDIEKFMSVGMTNIEVDEYEKTFEVINLEPNVVFHVQPGYVHRVIAITDLEFIETSTTELDDVYRLQDDFGRTHGRISYEHE